MMRLELPMFYVRKFKFLNNVKFLGQIYHNEDVAKVIYYIRDTNKSNGAGVVRYLFFRCLSNIENPNLFSSSL